MEILLALRDLFLWFAVCPAMAVIETLKTQPEVIWDLLKTAIQSIF